MMRGASGGGDDNRKRKMPEVPDDKPLLWIEELELLIVEHLAAGALGTIPTKHQKQMTWCCNGLKPNNENPKEGGFKYKSKEAKKNHQFVQRAIKRLSDVHRLLGRCNGMTLEEQDVELLMSFLPAAIARREEMYAALQHESEEDEGEDPNGPC